MTRRMTRLATALLLALTCSAPAAALACINDREVELSENEFRSRYGEQEKGQVREEPIELGLAPVGALGALAIGGALYLAGRRRSA